jgi:hypothetical protein
VHHHQGARVLVTGPHIALTRGHNGARPLVEPLGILGPQVDATVAHWLAEIVVPVGTMKGIISIEEHNIRDIGQVVAGTGHGLRADLQVDMIAACDRGSPASTARDQRPVNGYVTLIS